MCHPRGYLRGCLPEDHPGGYRIETLGPHGVSVSSRPLQVCHKEPYLQSKKVDFLVVGVTDFAVVKDGASSKMRKAIELAEAGHSVEIIDEADFLRLLNRTSTSC